MSEAQEAGIYMKSYVVTEPNHVDAISKYLLLNERAWPLYVEVCDGGENEKLRSIQQNKMFHAWMNEISRAHYLATGEPFSPKAWKEYFKISFLGSETMRLPDGSFISRTTKTSNLSSAKMKKFLDDIEHYVGSEMSEYGLILYRGEI